MTETLPKLSYAEKLKDPRWQKKRLKILELAQWKCECCQCDDVTLHIHHLIYSKGEPWDAPDETLECLCEDCHEWREDWNAFWGGRTLISTNLTQQLSSLLRILFTDRKFVRTSDTWSGLMHELVNYQYNARRPKASKDDPL